MVVAEANFAVLDLATFSAKVCISAALQHVKNVNLALHASEYPTQGWPGAYARPGSP